jgi:hypothetical protein
MVSSGFLQAQNSWMIVLNKKIVLTATVADEVKNVRLVRASEWKKNGFLEVKYRENPKSGWLHSIQFTDETGNALWVKDSVTSAKVSTATLRKLFTGKKELKIFILISPPDPRMMAPSRQVHLATLKLP